MKDRIRATDRSGTEIIETRWSPFGRTDVVLEEEGAIGLYVDGAAGSHELPDVVRPVTPKPCDKAQAVSLPRVGGLHHRYEWIAARDRTIFFRGTGGRGGETAGSTPEAGS